MPALVTFAITLVIGGIVPKITRGGCLSSGSPEWDGGGDGDRPGWNPGCRLASGNMYFGA